MGVGLALVLHPLLGHQQDHRHSHQTAANDVEDRGAHAAGRRNNRSLVILNLLILLVLDCCIAVLQICSSLIIVILHIKLPTFLASDLQYLGSLTTPLSMIFIGLSVSNAGVKQLVLKKDQLLILLGRFVVAPLLMAAIVYWAPLPTLMKQVFIIQSAMPVMTNAPVVAKLYGADSDYAAVMVTETTLATMVVIPILMVLMA